MAPPSARIELARESDLPHLPAIERAAATVFPEEDLSSERSADTTSPEQLRASFERGELWVARDSANLPVGFARITFPGDVTPHDSDLDVHLEEMDVHPDHARRGIGSALLQEVQEWVQQRRLAGITLTTFRHLAWNAPFYERHGFRPLEGPQMSARLQAILEVEARLGLAPEKRVAMRWDARRAPQHAINSPV